VIFAKAGKAGKAGKAKQSQKKPKKRTKVEVTANQTETVHSLLPLPSWLPTCRDGSTQTESAFGGLFSLFYL